MEPGREERYSKNWAMRQDLTKIMHQDSLIQRERGKRKSLPSVGETLWNQLQSVTSDNSNPRERFLELEHNIPGFSPPNSKWSFPNLPSITRASFPKV